MHRLSRRSPRPWGEAMRRRDFVKGVAGSAITWPLAAQAQQAERMRRLGVLMAVAQSDADARKGIGILQDRLQTLGWKDGNNIRIDYRWGNGNPDRIQDLAQELVDLQPDVLVGHSTPSAKGLLKQSHTDTWLEILYPQQRRARINRLQIQPVIGRGLGVENGSDSPNTGHNLLEKVDPNPGA